MHYDLVWVALGFLSYLILFFRFPALSNPEEEPFPEKLSVIIPSRNEETNLPLILSDLKNQSLEPLEIICVDDCSTDGTASVARNHGARVVTITEKPDKWLGKSYACQAGADAALGEHFLFLDVDVRLGRDGLKKLFGAYKKEKCTVSALPYHRTERLYEHFSLFFNIVQFAANGLSGGKSIGLIGPVILIGRDDYYSVNGHNSIKESVIDDISLGIELKKHRLPFKLFIGGRDVAFRMYPGGFTDLFRGWLKNFASGAAKTQILRFLMIFMFITSCLAVPLDILINAVNFEPVNLIFFALLYVLWVLCLTRVSRQIGSFGFLSLLFYPLALLMFIAISIVSLIKKIFRMKTYWKGRKV